MINKTVIKTGNYVVNNQLETVEDTEKLETIRANTKEYLNYLFRDLIGVTLEATVFDISKYPHTSFTMNNYPRGATFFIGTYDYDKATKHICLKFSFIEDVFIEYDKETLEPKELTFNFKNNAGSISVEANRIRLFY